MDRYFTCEGLADGLAMMTDHKTSHFELGNCARIRGDASSTQVTEEDDRNHGRRSESQECPDKNFSLRRRGAPDVNQATSTADESDLRIRQNGQPLALDLESHMAGRLVEADSGPEPEREAGEADT